MKRSILETIGTPMLQMASPPGSTIAAKLECFNPGRSSKDRPALAMIEAAEKSGELEPGGTIVEPTSGNTGIGLAIAAAEKGYELTIVMPASKSVERRRLLRAYGAEIELVEGVMQDANARARQLAAETNGVLLDQFSNPANANAHYRTTATEIIDDLDGRQPDAFVAAIGTGGTITGVAQRFADEFEDTVRIVGVEPAANPILSEGEPGEDAFQGMGPGFVSELLDVSLIDHVETVPLARAEAECRRLSRSRGVLVGQSSGAALIAARRVARRMAEAEIETAANPGGQTDQIDPQNGTLVVTILPDSGERYLSAGTFDSQESDP